MKGKEKMPTIDSLQELIVALKVDGSVENSNLLRVADMIVGYCNRPAREITIEGLQKHMRYFPLYLSFLRIPLDEVEPIVEVAHSLFARAAGMHRA